MFIERDEMMCMTDLIYCADKRYIQFNKRINIVSNYLYFGSDIQPLNGQLSQNARQLCSELEYRYAESAIFLGDLLALMINSHVQNASSASKRTRCLQTRRNGQQSALKCVN